MLLEIIGDDHGVRRLCPEPAKGASPWVFPVLADAPGEFRRQLLAHGVASIGFWRSGHAAIPLHLFPFEQQLRRQVVALPVHQGLSLAEAARIGDVVRRYSSQG